MAIVCTREEALYEGGMLQAHDARHGWREPGHRRLYVAVQSNDDARSYQPDSFGEVGRTVRDLDRSGMVVARVALGELGKVDVLELKPQFAVVRTARPIHCGGVATG